MSIGSIGGGSSMMMQAAQGGPTRERLDPAQMAEKLFAKLDSSGQGYLDRSDLQAAFDKVSPSSSSSTSGTLDIDGLMAQLDGNGDGKVTESEFANKLESARSGAHHAGRHGPPPPQQDDDPNAPDTASGSARTCAAATSSTDDASSKAMMQIMRLAKAYGAGSESSRSTASQVAVTA